MKTRTIIAFAASVILIITAVVAALVPISTPDNAKSKYFCDASVFSITTNVDIKNADGNYLYNVNGEFFSTYEDNLVMQDPIGNVIREMSDKYNLVTQNDHTILDGNGILYSCQGNLNIVNNSYDVFNNQKEQIGYIEFNAWDTYGTLCNMDGEVMAQYNSNIFCVDYVVSVFENCEIDDDSVLMMFASYYSDMRADG